MTKSKENILKKLRQICIYHSDDGTSGYLLNEDQFADIGKMVEEAERKGIIRGQLKERDRLKTIFEIMAETAGTIDIDNQIITTRKIKHHDKK